ncbi:hypothetical protein M5689_014982 [Euphorbia peplus]|nr:hypothetical protein M5689_014982 [Euphorbia peplus]
MQPVNGASLKLIDENSCNEESNQSMTPTESEASSNDEKEDEQKVGCKRARKMVIGRPNTFDQDNSRLKLARMIVMHELPFKIIELEGFKDYSASLQPCFKMPC